MVGMERQGREEEGRAGGTGLLLQELGEQLQGSTEPGRDTCQLLGSIVDGSIDSGPQREQCPVRKLSQGRRPGTSVGPFPQVVTAEAGQVLCVYP